MKIEKMSDNRVLVEADLTEIEEYPAWQSTQLVHIKINDKKGRWTDCWLSAINKRGQIRFNLFHEKGYPSENKGIAERSITAKWLSNKIPE